LTTVLTYGVLLLLIYVVFRIYEPFLGGAGVGGDSGDFFLPDATAGSCGVSPRLRAAVSLSTLVVTCLLIAPAILGDYLVHREAFSVSRGVQHTLLVQQAPMLAKSWVGSRNMCRAWIPTRCAGDAGPGCSKTAGFLAERLGTILAHIAAFIFDLFVMIFAMFIFSRRDQISGWSATFCLLMRNIERG